MFFVLGLQGVAARGGNLKKTSWRSAPRRIGCSCISWPRKEATLMFLCSASMLFLEGVSLQEEPGCIGSSVTRCLSVLVCLFLVSVHVGLGRSLVVRGGVGGLLLLLLLVGKGVATRGGNPKEKEAGGGLGGGRSASPQMHWMFLHLLAAKGGNLNVFVLGLHVVLGRGVAAEEPGCIGSGVTRCLSVLVCLFLVSVHVGLGRSLVVRGGVEVFCCCCCLFVCLFVY